MTVSVTDESCPTRSQALQVNVFSSTMAQTPKIKVRKDLVVQVSFLLMPLRLLSCSAVRWRYHSLPQSENSAVPRQHSRRKHVRRGARHPQRWDKSTFFIADIHLVLYVQVTRNPSPGSTRKT
jgi:hypothetical protein